MRRALATVLLIVAGAPLLPGQVLDVEQNNNTTCMASFSQIDLAQSFQPTFDNVSGAGIFLSSGSDISLITIELWDALPTTGGATLLATGSATGTSGAWVDVFWPAETVTPGLTYYLVFKSPGSDLCVAGDTGNPYPGGQVYANSGFGSFPSFDYTFHTWGNDTPLLSVTPPIAGGFMDITMISLTPGSEFILVMSSLGPGPTSTPFGTIEVSLPWRQTPRFPEIGGRFDWTSTVPIGAFGQTFYMQAVEFELGGETEISNAIAVQVG